MPEQPTIDECLDWLRSAEPEGRVWKRQDYVEAIRAILEAMKKRGITLEDVQYGNLKAYLQEKL